MTNTDREAALLSIVIITKDTRVLLEGLLASIARDHTLQPLLIETIVIDNGSTDGTDRLITQKFPTARYEHSDENRGFAAAVNKGRSLAQGRYILYLNSDTLLIEGEVAKMVVAAGSFDNLAIMGPQLVYEDLGAQRSTAAVPSLAGELLPGSQKGSRSPHDGGPSFEDADSLIGAAIMVRAEAFDALRGFDERFFFFLEETDFCVRAREAGFRVLFFPGARVIHLQGQTVKKTWVRGRMEYAISLRKFMLKHHGRLYTFVFDLVRFIKASAYVILLPFLLLGSKTRLRYSYYARLVVWYLTLCPDNAGLRS